MSKGAEMSRSSPQLEKSELSSHQNSWSWLGKLNSKGASGSKARRFGMACFFEWVGGGLLLMNTSMVLILSLVQ